MYWVAMGMVIIRTVATIVEPARMAKADSILMAHCLGWLLLTLRLEIKVKNLPNY
jgi:hypothetical protein